MVNVPWSLVGVDRLSYFLSSLSSALRAVSSSLFRLRGASGDDVTSCCDDVTSGGADPTVTVTFGVMSMEFRAAVATAAESGVETALAAASRLPRKWRLLCVAEIRALKRIIWMCKNNSWRKISIWESRHSCVDKRLQFMLANFVFLGVLKYTSTTQTDCCSCTHWHDI